MKPLLHVDSIKSCFRIRLDRKSKTDRKLHDKSDSSVFSWGGRDDEATGVLQTEGDNEHDIRHSADEGRVQTLTAQGVPSFEGTSLEKSSNETKTTATTAVRGRVKGLFAPMFRAITMKNQRMPEVKKRHVEELSIKTDEVEQHPVEESGNMIDEAVHGVKSRSLPEDIQENRNTSCEREEATGDEVGIFSIPGQDKNEKSEIMNIDIRNELVESQGLDEKKLVGYKENNIQRSSIPSAELSFTPEEESSQFLPVTTEQNSSGKTMECRKPASTWSPFAAQKIPPSPKACDLRDDIMSPRTDQNTNCTRVKSHSTKEGSTFTTKNCETSSANSLPPPNEAIPSFPRTSNSSGSVIHDISFSKELDHDASSDNMKVCRDAEQVIVKSLQSKKNEHKKSHAITQEEPMPVTFDEQMKCTVLSKEKTDVSTFSPPTVPIVQTCDSASTVNPTPKYDTEDNTVSEDTAFTIAKGKVDNLFKGSKIPITRAVSDSAAMMLSSQEAEAVKAYRLAKPLSWSGDYKSYKPIVSDEDDDFSYVTHLSGIDEDGPFGSSRCGLSDDMHDTLIWWGERIYKTFGEPGDKTKEKMLDIMRSSEEAAYVVRDLSQLKF